MFHQFLQLHVKYSIDWKQMTYHAFTGLTKMLGNTDTATLVEHISGEKFAIISFIKDLLDLYTYFNEHFLNNEFIVNLKKDYDNVLLLLTLLIDKKLNVVDNSYTLTFDDIILLKCIKENLENKIESSSSHQVNNYQTELELLKKELEFIRNNNSTSNSQIFVDKFDNLPDDFENSKKILSQELEKKLVNENHINNFKLYIDKKTAPPSLFFDKFPAPFLPCDSSYVESFNKLIFDFQTAAMNLAIKSCTSKLVSIKSNLEKFRKKYSTVSNIKTLITDAENQVSKNCEDRFRKSASKINSYTPRGYHVRKRTQPQDNIETQRSRSRNPKRRLNFSNSRNNENRPENAYNNNRNKRQNNRNMSRSRNTNNENNNTHMRASYDQYNQTQNETNRNNSYNRSQNQNYDYQNYQEEYS